VRHSKSQMTHTVIVSREEHAEMLGMGLDVEHVQGLLRSAVKAIGNGDGARATREVAEAFAHLSQAHRAQGEL